MFKAGQIDATSAMTMLAQATSVSTGSAAQPVGGGDHEKKGEATKKRCRSPTPKKTTDEDDVIDPNHLEPASHLDSFLCG